jgi:hypothetical protein
MSVTSAATDTGCDGRDVHGEPAQRDSVERPSKWLALDSVADETWWCASSAADNAGCDRGRSFGSDAPACHQGMPAWLQRRLPVGPSRDVQPWLDVNLA